MPTPVLEANYYISKGQKTVGPCSLDDLHGYIAYGSVRDSDLVRREGATEWTPLHQLAELQLDGGNPATSRNITTRRRTARYRDYQRVPQNQRSGRVLGRLLLGFLFFPPALWRGASSVYQDRVYSSKKDDKGYLMHWPQWCDRVVTVMLVINSFLWVGLIWLAWREAAPFLSEVFSSLAEAMDGLIE